MKRWGRGILVIVVTLFSAFGVQAQMDNLTNLSVEWMRMPARNAALDSADIVVYNPAGLVKLADGWHLNLGNQSLFRHPQHSFDLHFGKGEQTFEQEKSDPLLPNLYAAYKKGRWALYAGFYISGGGAVADYPNGSLTTELIGLQTLFSPAPDGFGVPPGTLLFDLYSAATNQSLKASSYYLTFTVGGAYAFSDAFSLSLGLRYLNATNKTEAGLTLTDSPLSLPDLPFLFDTKDKASGLGAVIGLNWTATPKLTLAAHYESAIKLDFETTVDTDDFGIAVNGAKSRRDLPAVLYLGAGYQVGPKLLLLADFNYYFQKSANWGATEVAGMEMKWADFAGDCTAAGIGVAYQAGKNWLLSAGAVYTHNMFKDKELYYTRLGEFEAPKNSNWNLGAGFARRLTDKLKLNVAVGATFWQDATVKSLSAEAFQAVNPFLDPLVKIKARAYSVTVGLNLDL